MEEEYWRTEDDRLIAVGDMDHNHLKNVLRGILRKRRERDEDIYGECDATEFDLY